ncbi:MAG: hypothetical protein HZB29_09285 [Nitrospinae bacterium]|nr:hypothetical protein [Nitrospinota bacterium]
METSKSLTPLISEEEFLPLAEIHCRKLLFVLSVINDENMIVNKHYYFTLMQEAEKLEGFLDDHGARSNMRWLYFAELVACVRNFSIAGFYLYHILDRYLDYLGGDADQMHREFRDAAYNTLDYFAFVLSRFHSALVEEATAQGIKVGERSAPAGDWGLKVIPKLPYTIVGSEISDVDERMISIAQDYRRVFKIFRQNGLDRRIKATKLLEIIPGKISETMFTGFEADLHNIQSEYDTYIKGGRLGADPNAVALRGLTAIPMHLFDMLRWLVHFFERHEYETEARKGSVKGRIAELVDDGKLLATIVGFGLRFSGKYLNEGNKVAERILSSYVKPVSYELAIPRPQGFHARPATYISLVVQEHGTDVFMHVSNEKFDCRSVLEILQAGGLIADLGLNTVKFEGDTRALDDLKILAEHNYCEDQEIPQSLSYLRILRNL